LGGHLHDNGDGGSTTQICMLAYMLFVNDHLCSKPILQGHFLLHSPPAAFSRFVKS